VARRHVHSRGRSAGARRSSRPRGRVPRPLSAASAALKPRVRLGQRHRLDLRGDRPPTVSYGVPEGLISSFPRPLGQGRMGGHPGGCRSTTSPAARSDASVAELAGRARRGEGTRPSSSSEIRNSEGPNPAMAPREIFRSPGGLCFFTALPHKAASAGVEGARRAHHGSGHLGVRQVVATDVGGLCPWTASSSSTMMDSFAASVLCQSLERPRRARRRRSAWSALEPQYSAR